RGVVGQEEAIVTAVRRGQRDNEDDVGGLFLDGDALAADLVGKAWFGGGDAVLHEHLGGVEVSADLEGDGQGVGAVGGAVGRHVQHVLDAVHLLLDRRRDGFGDDKGVGARVNR